jgi:hypothetical protein
MREVCVLGDEIIRTVCLSGMVMCRKEEGSYDKSLYNMSLVNIRVILDVVGAKNPNERRFFWYSQGLESAFIG